MIENFVLGTAFSLVGFTLCLGVYVTYKQCTAETFSLKKDQWTCTKEHTETHTSSMLVGKVMVPQTRTETVCDRWERK